MIEQFAVSYALSLVFLCVFERTMNSVFCLIFKSSAVKQQAAQLVLVKQVEFWSGFVMSWANVLLRCFFYLLSWWILLLVLFMMLSVLRVTYYDYPETWIRTIEFYNANVGPYVSQAVLVPLQFLDAVLRGLLPLWNASVWWSKTLFTQGFLPIAIQNAKILFQMATAVLDVAKHLGDAMLLWVQSFECEGVACFVPEDRVVDFLSPLGSLRLFSALALKFLQNICGTLTAPLDILIYPLLDLNLAQAVHASLNSVLQLAFTIPHVTTQRCAVAPSDVFHTILCTPDLSPFFNFLSFGLSSLGIMLDNWLNIVLVVVQSVLTGTSPVCDPSREINPADIMSVASIFGSNFTAVVGLTNWLYAVTDGYQAVYQGGDDEGFRILRWPHEMNPSLGVAAVSFASVSTLDSSSFTTGNTASSLQTTDLFACNCTDTDQGILILCAVLPSSGVPPRADRSSYLSQVFFPDPFVPELIGSCSMVRISVHSHRFPANRYETKAATLGQSTATLPTADCVSRGTCRELDALVYVTPNCAYGKGCTSSCFPFCIAARPSGSANNNLQLVTAAQWRLGSTILQQDCAVRDSTVDRVSTSVSQSAYTSSVASQSNANAGIFTAGPSSTACKPAPNIFSMGPRKTSTLRRDAVNLPGQPLFTSGDVIFTERVLQPGASAVVVERLVSDARNTFSLQTLNQDFPAVPPLSVQSKEKTYDDPSHLLIPSSTQYQPPVAVSSRNYVFYAVPPALSAVGAYLEFCKMKQDGGESNFKAGLLLTSSYAPIRIYRVSAFRQCRAYSCGDDLVRYVQLQGFDTSYLSAECSQSFNVSVARLEYLNEDNIAVVVQYTKTGEYDVDTGTAKGPNTGYTVYWLNPPSMRMSKSLWRTSIPTSSYGTLCPGMQRMPRVGSLMAEILGAGVSLFKYVVGIVVYTPGMSKVWASGGRCPLSGASYGHSILANCGEDIFSLEDFFDHLDDAGLLFWHTLSVAANFISPGGEVGAVSDILNGMAQYGQGSVDLWAAGRSIITLVRMPIAEQVKGVMAMVQNGPSSASAAIGAGFQVGAGAIAWARFSYRLLSEVALAITKMILTSGALTSDAIWREIWAILYDLRAYFRAVITERNRMACSGIKLMMGVDNPWAELAYSYCSANAEYYNAMLDIALHIFVDIPKIKCVCLDARGRPAQAFVQDVCAPRLPLSVRPEMYMMVAVYQGLTSSAFRNLACEAATSSLKTSMKESLTPVFENMEKGLEAMNSVFDYLLVPFDKDSGRCLDFSSDVHATVLMPFPPDYFMGCAKTTLCKSLCGDEWDAFSRRNATPITMPENSLTTESMFFPGELSADMVISGAIAVTQVSPEDCVARTPPDQAIRVAHMSGQDLHVSSFCAPQTPGQGVYRQGFTMLVQALPGSVSWASFFGYKSVLLLIGSKVYNATDGDLSPIPDAPVPENYNLMGIDSLFVLADSLIVACALKHYEGQDLVAAVSISEFYGQRWYTQSRVDLSSFFTTHTLTALPSNYILLPKEIPQTAYTFTIFRTASGRLDTSALTPLESITVGSVAINGLVVSSFSLSSTYIFAVSQEGWNWLSQVRIDGALGVFQSTQTNVKMRVQGSCDEKSCEGCPDLLTNRLCQAYSRCAIINCVGTPVNMRRPLCSLGGLLRTYGALSVQSFRGMWNIVSEIMLLVIKLSTTKVAGVEIEFPEDNFMGYVCTIKNAGANFFSIITSMLNGAIQLSGANVNYIYHGATNVDTNADAALTITLSTVTNFLSQLYMLPLYLAVATDKTTRCQVC